MSDIPTIEKSEFLALIYDILRINPTWTSQLPLTKFKGFKPSKFSPN